MFKFLGNLVKGALGAFAGGVGSKAADKATDAVFGPQSKVSLSDYQHYQNLLDVGNPREIARQNQFLAGVTPGQADAHNVYQDMTYGQDTARYQERMDTLFPGTSPWERLGSSASSPLHAPEPPQRGESGQQFLSQLAPLAQAKMQVDSQKQVARIQADTAKDVAKIHQDTELEKTHHQTAGGQLAASEVAVNKARELLIFEQQYHTAWMSEHEREKAMKERLTSFLEALPTETIDLGLIKYESKPGWNKVLAVLKNPYELRDRDALDKVISSLSAQEWSVIRKDSLQLAGLLAKTSGAVSGGLRGAGKFLEGLGKRGRNAPPGKRKVYVDN